MILFTVIQTYYASVRFLSKSLASGIDLRRRFLAGCSVFPGRGWSGSE